MTGPVDNVPALWRVKYRTPSSGGSIRLVVARSEDEAIAQVVEDSERERCRAERVGPIPFGPGVVGCRVTVA